MPLAPHEDGALRRAVFEAVAEMTFPGRDDELAFAEDTAPLEDKFLARLEASGFKVVALAPEDQPCL